MSSRSLTLVAVPAEPADPQVATDPVQQFADSRYESIKQILDKHNGGFFHKCCFAFSSRKYVHRRSHPESSTVRISKFFKEHEIDSKERFVEVLRELLASSPVPNPPTAPLYNEPHPSEPLGKRSPSRQSLDDQELHALQDTVSDLKSQLAQEQERSAHLEAQLRDVAAENNKLRFWMNLNFADPDCALRGEKPSLDIFPYGMPVVYNYPEQLPDFPVPSRSHPHWRAFSPLVRYREITSEQQLNQFLARLPPPSPPKPRSPPN